MSRRLQVAALVLCLLGPLPATHATNTYFWISPYGFPSASPLPASSSGVPDLYSFNGLSTGSAYLWGRPEVGKTLKNWSLNLVLGDSSIVTFTSAEVYGPSSTGVTRWEYSSTPSGDSTSIKNINAFTLSSSGGSGISSATQGSDLYFDAANNAWLLAKVNYSLKPFVGFKSANLSLQVGDFGANNSGEGVSDITIVFGHNGDTPITLSNVSSVNRNVNIGAHDAVVKYYATPDADFDNDLDVDGRDFLIWQRNYLIGTLNTQGNANPGTGSGQDSLVNAVDRAAWQYRYGLPVSLVAASVAVPEPNTAVLILAVVVKIASGRRINSCIRLTSTCVPRRGEL